MILLYYPIENVVQNCTNIFNVYLPCEGGTAAVDTEEYTEQQIELLKLKKEHIENHIADNESVLRAGKKLSQGRLQNLSPFQVSVYPVCFFAPA